MNDHELLALFDREMRIEIEYPDMTKEVLPHVTRFLRPAPGANFILYSQLDDENAETVIAEQVEYLKQLNQPFEWKVYDHDRPPDLTDRLAAKGLIVDEPDAVMILDLASTPASMLKEQNVEVRPIEDRSNLGDVVKVLENVWDRSFEWAYARLGAHLEIPGYLKIFVAYQAEIPACTGWVYFHPHSQFASLWGGSTIPEYRDQGLYTAVLAVRVKEAIRRGYRYMTIDASSMSRPIVERHGFRLLTYAHACEWKIASS